MPVTNPIRLVYEAIWSMLEGQTEFNTLVRTANRLKYTDTLIKATEKSETLTQADFPQVRVIHFRTSPHIFRTSNSSTMRLFWKIEVATGKRQFQSLLDVDWAIYQAMSFWPTYFTGLSMEANGYTITCYPIEVLTRLGDPRIDRGTVGWSSVWAGVSEISFLTTALGT